MALNPLQDATERIIDRPAEPTQAQPLKTYQLDLGAGRIRGFVDGKQAVEQFVRKAIETARFRHLIYDGQYGCELDDLIGSNVTRELIDVEIPRVIEDALIYDDRIRTVSGFDVTHEGDRVYVAFTVEVTDGTRIQFNEEVSG